MSDAALSRMDGDTFLEWCLTQEGKWELVDGIPVQVDWHPAEGMAGATSNHDDIVVNLILALGPRLKGGPCRPSTADKAARMVAGNLRRPDVTVDCARGGPRDLESAQPTVFFEVLSPSTQSFDFIVKAEEYRLLPTLRHFALVHPDRAEAVLWARQSDGGWLSDRVVGLEGALRLTALGFDLPMAEIYDGVQLEG